MIGSRAEGNMFLTNNDKVVLENLRQYYHAEMSKASKKNLNTSGGTNQTNEEQKTNEEQRERIKTATTKMKELAKAFGNPPTLIRQYSRESDSDFTKRKFIHVKGHLYLYITISDITRNDPSDPRLTKMQEVTEAIRAVNINFPEKDNTITMWCGILVFVAFILATIIHALLDNQTLTPSRIKNIVNLCYAMVHFQSSVDQETIDS